MNYLASESAITSSFLEANFNDLPGPRRAKNVPRGQYPSARTPVSLMPEQPPTEIPSQDSTEELETCSVGSNGECRSESTHRSRENDRTGASDTLFTPLPKSKSTEASSQSRKKTSKTTKKRSRSEKNRARSGAPTAPVPQPQSDADGSQSDDGEGNGGEKELNADRKDGRTGDGTDEENRSLMENEEDQNSSCATTESVRRSVNSGLWKVVMVMFLVLIGLSGCMYLMHRRMCTYMAILMQDFSDRNVLSMADFNLGPLKYLCSEKPDSGISSAEPYMN